MKLSRSNVIPAAMRRCCMARIFAKQSSVMPWLDHGIQKKLKSLTGYRGQASVVAWL
ncbi:hypothetical protein [Rickettsia endosymbiont of Orchestes rusci]|uniref:hypothetical protein n=1 Tax=Rickettsia endosymbiont of Orchestes rusci TaxID=3066250 RepID=UPI00313EB1A0